ncbi:hypothetical protein ACS0TY_000085 [Phlomoides rotata]
MVSWRFISCWHHVRKIMKDMMLVVSHIYKEVIANNDDDDNETNRKIAKKMTIVALWCIQMSPASVKIKRFEGSSYGLRGILDFRGVIDFTMPCMLP